MSGKVLQGAVPGANSSVSVSNLDSIAIVHHNYKAMLFEHLTGIKNLLIGSIVRSRDNMTLGDLLGGAKNSDSLMMALGYIVNTMKFQS